MANNKCEKCGQYLRNKTETKTPMTVDEFKFLYGKHAGKGLREVYSEDPNYLVWVAKEFKNIKLREFVKDFLECWSETNA